MGSLFQYYNGLHRGLGFRGCIGVIRYILGLYKDDGDETGSCYFKR